MTIDWRAAQDPELLLDMDLRSILRERYDVLATPLTARMQRLRNPD